MPVIVKDGITVDTEYPGKGSSFVISMFDFVCINFTGPSIL